MDRNARARLELALIGHTHGDKPLTDEQLADAARSLRDRFDRLREAVEGGLKDAPRW